MSSLVRFADREQPVVNLRVRAGIKAWEDGTGGIFSIVYIYFIKLYSI